MRTLPTVLAPPPPPLHDAVCIFAYGQTGSGKTFTIYGDEKNPGLTPRGVSELYSLIEANSGKYSFRVSVFMLELYCDDLADLLAEKKTGQASWGVVGWVGCLLRGVEAGERARGAAREAACC